MATATHAYGELMVVVMETAQTRRQPLLQITSLCLWTPYHNTQHGGPALQSRVWVSEMERGIEREKDEQKE